MSIKQVMTGLERTVQELCDTETMRAQSDVSHSNATRFIFEIVMPD